MTNTRIRSLASCWCRQRVRITSLATRQGKGPTGVAVWLAAGGRFEVHGWAKRGGRREYRVIEVKADDLEPVELVSLRRKRTSRWKELSLFSELEGTASSLITASRRNVSRDAT
jgi:hypothetical protein